MTPAIPDGTLVRGVWLNFCTGQKVFFQGLREGCAKPITAVIRMATIFEGEWRRREVWLSAVRCEMKRAIMCLLEMHPYMLMHI